MQRLRSIDGDVNRLGTEFGESRMSSVVEVTFQRENRTTPSRVVVVRYDDAAGLRARGIVIFELTWRSTSVTPDPFPHSRCAPPPTLILRQHDGNRRSIHGGHDNENDHAVLTVPEQFGTTETVRVDESPL